MSILIDEILNKLTIRAGAALLLSMAESVSPELEKDKEGFSLSRKGLDLAWQWQSDDNISGDILTDYINTPDDYGTCLLVYQQYYENKPVMKYAIIVVCIAVSYTALCAYKIEKEISIPEFIDILQLNDVIRQILDIAKKTNVFDRNKFINAYTFLLKEYSTDNQNELGEPVEKEVLMAFYQ